MSQGGGVGGGFGARLQSLVRAGQDALNKITKKDGGDTKAPAGKPEVKGGAQTAQSGGVKAKGKAKGKEMSAVESLMRGSDEFGVDEDADRERRRKRRLYMGDTSGPDFETKDSTEEKSAVAHISAEFRGQVASGMVEGRSFTQGSCLVPEGGEEEEDAPKKKKR